VRLWLDCLEDRTFSAWLIIIQPTAFGKLR
jgi:hypothetical protein